MNPLSRRALLASSAIGVSSIVGCLGHVARNDAVADETIWRREPGGRAVVVSDDILYGLEDFTEGDGSVVALGTVSGNSEWTYGETGGYSAYTPPVVDDAVYFGLGDDAVGSGSGELYALEFDGTERFTAETGSVYDRPRLADGAAFVGTDDGRVYAFEVEDGTDRWSIRFDDESEKAARTPTVEAVDDGVVYVTAGGRIRAIDAESATERWQYDVREASRRIHAVTIDDGVYVATGGELVAVDGSDERWQVDLDESYKRISGVVDGTIFLDHQDDLVAFDTDDGTERWRDESVTVRRVRVADDAIYLGDDESAALRVTDLEGDERWTVELEGSEVERIRPADDAVYAATDAAVHRIDRDGAVISTVPLEGVRSLVVDDRIYAATSEAFYALEL